MNYVNWGAMTDSVKPEKSDSVVSLSDLSAKEAIKLVKSTSDESQLSAWAESEERKSVLEALSKAMG